MISLHEITPKDNASFIATLTPDLRAEVLLTMTEEVLRTLPPEIVAEADVFRTTIGNLSVSMHMYIIYIYIYIFIYIFHNIYMYMYIYIYTYSLFI